MNSPQPPPDVHAPPPGPEAIRSRRIVKILFGIPIVLVLLIAIMVPLVLRNKRSANRYEALSDLKAIGRELREFESLHGKFPDDSTNPAVKALDHTGLRLGARTSNDYFRQLLATGSKSEKIYFAGISTRHFYPNDILGSEALTRDECSFSYIPGLSSASSPEAPAVITPLVPGTRKFDPKPFGKMATVLFVDGSVQALPIDKNGDVILNGMNLFDPRQPFWGGKPPDIKYPE